MSPRKPDFFIVGAPKCGTSAMHEYLRQHPDIFMPEIKEIHHFGSDLHVRRMANTDEYLSLFADATDERRVGEASVWYLYSKVAANEIKEFSPGAQAIIMVRNPVDRVQSHHSYALYRGNETIADLAAAIEDEERRKQTGSSQAGPLYKQSLNYTEQVKRYVEVFGWDSLHIIIYDDFKEDPAGTYRKLLRFLGVDEDFRPQFKVINPNKRARSWRLQRVLFYPPEGMRAIGRKLLPQSVRRGIITKLMEMNSRQEQRLPMDPELRRRLQRKFAPEVERLSELLGRDLTHWSRD